jgi:plastocyanin
VSWRVALLASCAGLAVVTNAMPGANAAGVSAVTRLQVVEDEWRATPSRTRARPGTLSIEVVNIGEDDHNLVVARAGGGPRATSGTLRPGDRVKISVRARRGTYKLLCSISDHAERGMRSKIRVR